MYAWGQQGQQQTRSRTKKKGSSRAPTAPEAQIPYKLAAEPCRDPLPTWHPSCMEKSGDLSADAVRFTKNANFHGRLTLITEAEVQTSGVKRYAVVFDEGQLSPADGVGFAFGTTLPSTQNIQKV